MKYLTFVMILLLSACSSTSYYDSTHYVPYQGYSYDEYQGFYGPNERQFDNGYNGAHPDRDQSHEHYRQSQQVRVPNSYHVGRYRSPEKPRSRDSRWVNSQQSRGGYTIEIARGSQASKVAKDLMRAPKNDRTAAVRSGNGFVGVYGSYNSYEQAKRALNQLPADLRRKARIKSWGSVR